ncbi:MAG: hypothetical protein ACREC5_07895, partial [Thermoplasmata archaeon]
RGPFSGDPRGTDRSSTMNHTASETESRALASDEHPVPPTECREGPRPVGRLRLPLGLHQQPWATLYRFPDGRLEWCVRLWHIDRPVWSIVPTHVLRRYARESRLPELVDGIEALLEAACGGSLDAAP